MKPWLIGSIVFLCSAVHECGCVLWVHNVDSHRRWRAIGWSCLVATVQLVGIYESFAGLVFAMLYVIGHGAGTYLGMLIKR